MRFLFATHLNKHWLLKSELLKTKQTLIKHSVQTYRCFGYVGELISPDALVLLQLTRNLGLVSLEGGSERVLRWSGFSRENRHLDVSFFLSRIPLEAVCVENEYRRGRLVRRGDGSTLRRRAGLGWWQYHHLPHVRGALSLLPAPHISRR